MRIYVFIRRIGILTSLVLISWLPALSTQAADQPLGGSPPVVLTGGPASMAADQPLGGSPPVVLTGGPASMAAGGVEDTLKACLARIPKDGSAGQRMLAEQSCEHDEGTRKLGQDAPKF